MPVMQNSVSVAANGVSTNQLAGLLYEFIEQPAEVTLSCTGSATGLNVTFIIGGVSVVQDQAIGLQNRFPLIPDDVLDVEAVETGRLILTSRNTTGGALIFFWRVDVDFNIG